MKLIVELDKLDAHVEKVKLNLHGKQQELNVIKWYDVAFSITHEDINTKMYAPTTVPFKEGMTEANIIQIAAREVLPGQIAIAYDLIEKEREKEKDGN